MTPEEFDAGVERFAALVQQQHQARLRRQDYPFWESEIVKVHPRKLYTLVDVGPEHNMSGRYMIEHATGTIYGIKGYGKVHKGHRYGTLDTLDGWEWGGYTARRTA